MDDNRSSSERDGGERRRFYVLYGIIIAIVVGVVIGGLLPDLAVGFSFLGEMFLNLLMMIVVPLVILSMIVGITNLGDIRNLGAIGRRTIIYYLTTTGISVLIGIILVNIVQPGSDIRPGENRGDLAYTIDSRDNTIVVLTNGTLERKQYGEQYVLKLIDQQMKGTIESASSHKIKVKFWEDCQEKSDLYLMTDKGHRVPVVNRDGQLIVSKRELQSSGTGIEITLPLSERILGKEKKNVLETLMEVLVGDKSSGKEGLFPRNVLNAMVRMDILPLILFSLLVGASLSVLGDRGSRAIEVISVLNDAVMKIIEWIMLIAPFGIFGIISARIGSAGGFKGFMPELLALGKYSFTVFLGLTIHGMIVLPAILFLFLRRNPFRFMLGVGAALLNAFSTASSSATLPITMDTIERENGISNRTASFVLPIGATINMDGTALYEAVAAMFIAQVYGIELGLIPQAIVFVTATLAAIGAAGIPEAGLVTMVIVLRAVGLPVEGIGLILTIDWFLDRFRTTINVWGDSVGAGVIESLEMKD